MQKYLKISIYELCAVGFILMATALRIFFISQGGPLTNSDEGTMGIMALHIAYQGQHPIFFYGQNYMGSFEAFVAATLFHLFGPSLFSLRLGLVLMYVIFMFSMYVLVSLLYSRGFALVSLALLATGSDFILARELSAIGGYPETLMFGALVFLLATLLALTYQPTLSLRRRVWRLFAYAAWGFCAGLALWCDLLVAPFVLMSGLLLLVCWRELLKVLPVLMLLAGLILGALPLIRYNLHAAPGQDSWSVFLSLRHSGQSGIHYTKTLLYNEVKNTVQISIPSMTGEPFCPVTEAPFLGPNSPRSAACTLAHNSWGVGYVLLFATALLSAFVALWRSWRALRSNKDAPSPENTQDARRSLARLLLLGAALVSVFTYTFSLAPIGWPSIHARYIIGLLIALPAIFWPLWQGLRLSAIRRPHLVRFTRLACGALLALILGIMIVGTGMALSELPDIQARNAHDQALIHDLAAAGIKRIYTDYWTCNKIAFVGNERVICGVIELSLAPSGHSRYLPYLRAAQADPHSAYVLPVNQGFTSPEKKFPNQRFQVMHMDGYDVYVPL